MSLNACRIDEKRKTLRSFYNEISGVDKREVGKETMKLMKMWRETEPGLKGMKGIEKKEMKPLLGLDNAEKAYTMVHYFLTIKGKEKESLNVLTVRVCFEIPMSLQLILVVCRRMKGKRVNEV